LSARQVLADRTHRLDAPVSVIQRALSRDRAKWVVLHPGEVLPEVLDLGAERVVWSSLWPVSPDDTVEFALSRYGTKTALRFRWLTDSPPDERGIAITRQRLNTLLASTLRGWLTQGRAWAGYTR